MLHIFTNFKFLTNDYNFVINILEVFKSNNYFSPAQKPALSKCQNTLTMIYNKLN